LKGNSSKQEGFYFGMQSSESSLPMRAKRSLLAKLPAKHPVTAAGKHGQATKQDH